MLKWILASNNAHKVEEIMAVLKPLGIELLTMSEAGLEGIDVEETGLTFEENALLKADAIFKLTGQPVLADDSGLAVDALGGAPGIYSARYSGVPKSDQRNNLKLLEALQGLPAEKRKAQFVCVLAYVSDSERFTIRGEAEGVILEEMAGTNGFGYDPLFYSLEGQKTFALLTAEEKNTISHRAKALQLLKDRMLGGPSSECTGHQ